MARVLVVILLLCGGCVSTTRYLADGPYVDGGRVRACFEMCRMAHGSDDGYHACLSSCPDVRVDGAAACPFPSDPTPCLVREKRRPSMSLVLTVGALVLLGGIAVVVAASPH